MNRSSAAVSEPSPVKPVPAAKKESAARPPVSRWRYLLFLVLAAGGCAADLLTKHYVFQWRGMPRAGNEWWIVEHYFGIETAVNYGALFGMGHGYGMLFAALSVAAAVGVTAWVFYGQAARDLMLTVSLGCVLAGILGNLYDRLGLWHVPGDPEAWRSGVRDWILFRVGNHTWPNFNIADSLLVCGAFLLFWHSFRQPERPPEKSEADQK